MTKNAAQKRDARAYQAAHPGVTFHDAMRAVKRPAKGSSPRTSPVLSAISGSLRSLQGKRLTNDPEEIKFGAWTLDLDSDLESAEVYNVEIDDDTLDVRIHEVLPDGGKLGEARINAVLTYEAHIYKADYYAATADGAPEVDWYVFDGDASEHYVLVQGDVEVELIAHVQINGTDVELEFQGVKAR
ncbi:hypothetical protein ACFYVR_25195 [Rhodococcus sp. NPDC003318]|uniref:hypothetical protein n=1 Tax=Rhodococcus sp. NPDC003318 TaxID=3364503 RepID=UPI003677635A